MSAVNAQVTVEEFLAVRERIAEREILTYAEIES